MSKTEHPTPDPLQSYTDVMTLCDIPQDAAEGLAKWLVRQYTEGMGRRYHTNRHILSMIHEAPLDDEYVAFANTHGIDINAYNLAALFHDVIYYSAVRIPSCEQLSAGVLENTFAPMVEHGILDRRLIHLARHMVEQTHYAQMGVNYDYFDDGGRFSKHAHFMRMCDLYGFADHFTVLMKNGQRVVQEMLELGMYDSKPARNIFKNGRIKFLESLALSVDTIFAECPNAMERARKNLVREHELLIRDPDEDVEEVYENFFKTIGQDEEKTLEDISSRDLGIDGPEITEESLAACEELSQRRQTSSEICGND